MNRQTKTVALTLFLILAALSAASILTSLVPAKGASVPLILSWVLLLLAVFVTASIMWPEVKGAPWVPTSGRLVSRVLEMANLKQGEVLYDLGSGDGRIIIAAARDFGATAVGVEIEPFRAFWSRFKISQLHLSGKAKIVRRNFFDVDLKDADVVVLYLLQATNNKLQLKLERELKPSSRVVSVVWQFAGWELIRRDEKEMIFVYKPRTADSAN